MIVAVTPTMNNHEVLEETLEYHEKLDPGIDYHIILDNSDTPYDGPLPPGYYLHWITPEEVRRQGPYIGIAIARQVGLGLARRKMRENPEYGYLLNADDDVQPLDESALEILMTWGLDLVAGTYMRRLPWGEYLSVNWLPFGQESDFMTFQKTPKSPLMRPDSVALGFSLQTRELTLDKRVNYLPITRMDVPEDHFYYRTSGHFRYRVGADGTTFLRHKQTMERPWNPWFGVEGQP